MRLVLRPLTFAILLAAGSTAGASDLMQAYDLARQSDPVLAAAESQRYATGEGVPQARSVLLPQIGASASLTDSRTRGVDGYDRERTYGLRLATANDGCVSTAKRQRGLPADQAGVQI